MQSYIHAMTNGKFPSPCGEKLKYQMLCLKTINTGFSSPYGENPLSHGLRRASSPERGSFCSCR